MHEMTLKGLLRVGRSYFTEHEAKWMIIGVQAYGNEVEWIINPKANFKTKLEYYEQAYNEDLTLKDNSNIKIVDYDFVEHILFEDPETEDE
ncbi:hypothetical protein [Alkalicoccus chagannorensis]|uniref:hypothetical protein n=1 Tax=Alkalicoccus chagannorensis TaxID=427072 RepID=UPI000411D546|nr:hypothetical protein [Alkalicoccus chagannorensis]